jgi:hypothetical protein
MFKVMIDKNIMLMQINKIIEKLEKSDGKNLENINDELLDIAMSNKKEFQDIVKLEAIKNLDETIEKMEIPKKSNEEKVSLSSIIEDFIPKNINDTYFKSKREEFGTLEELKYHSSNFTNEITSDVDKKMQELTKDKEIDLDERKLLELKCFMEFGMKKIVNDEIENASNDIRFLTGIDNYKIDKDNISRGDLKAIRNSIVEREDYSKEEIKKDILLNKKNEKIINDDIDELKNEIYKTKRNIIMEEFAVDLAKDVITIEKNGGNRNSYSKENENIYKQSIKKTVNKLVDDNLSLEEIKKINKSNLEMYDNNYFNSFLIFENDLPISFVETNYLKGTTTSNINEQLFAKIKEVKGEEYLDNMNLQDIRDWNDLKRDLPNLEILYYENEFDNNKNNAIEYTDYEKYERDSIKTFLTFKLKDEEKYIVHKSIGNLSEERIELFIEDKKEYIENDLKIDLEYLNEQLNEKTKDLKEIKQTNKEEKDLENVKNEKEIDL